MSSSEAGPWPAATEGAESTNYFFFDDRDALVAGLLDGRICTTATDEYTTYKNIKLAGDTIRTVW